MRKKTKAKPNAASLPLRFYAGLFALVFFSHAYFYSSLGWNQVSRLDVVYNFVEPSPDQYSFKITRFITDPKEGVNTGDWAFFNGNYYSNKAPGASLLAIPVYFFVFHLEAAFGADPTSRYWAGINIYLLNLWVTVFWSAMAAVALFLLLEKRLGFSRRDSFISTVAYTFGTLIFPFDLQFWGHCTAASFLVISWYFLTGTKRSDSKWAGLFLGLAVLVEYAAAVFVPFSVLFQFLRKRQHLSGFLMGVVPGILILLLYQKICFGGFFTVAPSQNNPAFENPSGVEFWLPYFNLETAWTLLVSARRGLFVFMPLFLFCVAGSRQLIHRGRSRLVWIWGGSFLALLTLLVWFGYSDGGFSSGPRYLIVGLPLLCFLLPQWSLLSRPARGAYTALLALSVFNMTATSFTNTMALPHITNPLYGQVYGMFFSGSFPDRVLNLAGLFWGWQGFLTFVPWALGVGYGGYRLWKATA